MIYVDYAATTPMMKEAVAAMLPYLNEHYGNPSSVYAAGREAKKGLEEAREKVARAVGAQPAEIIFTAGGTEADNLALKGAVAKSDPNRNHIITTSVEHHAVLHVAEWLESRGSRVTFLPVGRDGVVDLEALKAALSPQTCLVSVMLANNEVGVVQPLDEVVQIVKQNSRALVHTDAVQALGKVPVDVAALGVDLASFSAHKLGGPKGVGALFIKRNTPVEPILQGGGQERGIRSGTPNVAGIVGFGTAAEIAIREQESEAQRLGSLRDRLQDAVLEAIDDIDVNAGAAERVPGVTSLCITGVEGESMLLLLDSKGVAASSGSACASGSLDPSHVLLAMGVPPERAHGSLRFSLGRNSTEEEIPMVVEALKQTVERLRSMAPRLAGKSA